MSLEITSRRWAERCAADGEFRLAARHWTGVIRLRIGAEELALGLVDGEPSEALPDSAELIEISGSTDVWSKVLRGIPPRFHNDVVANMTTGAGLTRSGDRMAFAQYYGALMRAIELLRPSSDNPVRERTAEADDLADRKFDAPTGRYVRMSLQGEMHRIYFEEAGQGIPLLLQHTAGCHGSQWRHLFEVPEITDHFRLIAYDLPFHGKSVPPTGRRWWSERYQLGGEWLRSIPLGLIETLGLEQPVFMGCSVGGLLALDLAFRHPDQIRAVIAVEGALKVEGDRSKMKDLWHPMIGNEYKARTMEGLTSPTSPDAYRKETAFIYASGWPPVFLGDLQYYLDEYDLTSVASEIDTQRVGVHILSGEYDYSGTVELGRAAHETIAGSTWSEMKGLGHFPMSENPEAFLQYLLPVLSLIRKSR